MRAFVHALILAVLSTIAVPSAAQPCATSPAEAPAEEREPTTGEVDAGEIDRLRALGYLDATAEPQDALRSGVVVRTDAAYPGYNLYITRKPPLIEPASREGIRLEKEVYTRMRLRA